MLRFFWTTLVCVPIAFGAKAAPAGDLPIPQNPARQEKAFQDLLEWNRQTLGGAYDKVGKKDPRWDAAAHEALEAAARMAGKAVDPASGPEDVFGPAKKAVEAGCDDPMILYLYAEASQIPNRPEPAEMDRRWKAAAKAMESSGYPPLRRALALHAAANGFLKKDGPTPDDKREASAFLDRAVALLPNAGSKNERNIEAEDQWFKLIREIFRSYKSIHGTITAGFKKVDPILAKLPALKAIRLQVRALTLKDEAWEIRGGGLANTVGEQAGRTFESKLSEAYKILQLAWAADPKSYRTPTVMLDVIIGLGLDRNEMELWFRRAMELKDDNAFACENKIDYLDPKWHGSQEEMMEFAAALKATKNWRGGLTVIAADAHWRATMLFDANERSQYFQKPEVWEDGKSIYEEYLAHYTKDDVARSEYAGFAYLCGRYVESAQQFKILGDRIVGSKMYPLDRLKLYKSFAESVVQRQAEQKAADEKRKKLQGVTPKK